MQIITGQPRRRWSGEQKLAAVAATFEPAATVAGVARQNGANTGMGAFGEPYLLRNQCGRANVIHNACRRLHEVEELLHLRDVGVRNVDQIVVADGKAIGDEEAGRIAKIEAVNNGHAFWRLTGQLRAWQ